MPGSDLNLPPMTPSELPSSGGGGSNPLNAPEDAASGMLTLTQDQLSSLGLEDCQPGDTYTVTLKKADSPGADAEFEVQNVAEGDGKDEDGMPGQADEGEIEPPDNEGAPPPGGADAGSNGAEAKIGVKRKSKPARAGLPSTMKLRDY